MIDWKSIQNKPLETLTDPEIIQKLCDELKIKPTRGAGQNFLIDSSILDDLLEAAEIKKSDCVLEIGSGFGALTIALAQKAKQVVAVEKDPRIFEALEKIVESYENVKLINDDILRLQTIHYKLLTTRYKLVANLPYSITSAVLRKFTEEAPKPSVMVVMVQKEVAERICAMPGEMSLLSVAIQFYAKPEIVKIISREAFWPEPEVDSAIIKLKVHKVIKFIKSGVDEKKFFQIVHIGFSSRRKQLQNNLAAGLRITNEKAREILVQVGFDQKIRAQELSVEDWIRLVKAL